MKHIVKEEVHQEGGATTTQTPAYSQHRLTDPVSMTDVIADNMHTV
ncbi:MAG: hypothetical protein HY270_08570 [Deltaproteobacteria bacterium]|nr:hypothetical protein [Deltaproteobacteria bacterium]